MKKILISSLIAAGLSSLHAQDLNVWLTAQSNFVAGFENDLDLPRHGHDPVEELYLQGLDVGVNFEALGWLSGFANLNSFSTERGLEFGAELEEAFLKVSNLESGLEFRGGRLLNRIGTQNNVHLHGWDFVDANLSTIQFLGEEGLATDSIELSWFGEADSSLVGISVAYGEIAGHHDEEDEEGEFDDDFDEDEEGHHDEEEEEEDEEHHGEDELVLEEGEALTARAFVRHNFSDYHQTQLGLNYLTSIGGDDFDFYGVDLNYTWRANGLESGGASFNGEFEYNVLDNGEDTFGNVLLGAHYRFGNGIGLHSRYEWLEFSEEETAVSRQRYSAAISYFKQLNEDWATINRLQYNHNRFEGDSDDSLWLQLGFSYGSGEIR